MMHFPIRLCVLVAVVASTAIAAEPTNVRKPTMEAELRYWLQNMVWHHLYTVEEVESATGLSAEEVRAALKRFDITAKSRPKRTKDAPLLVLPYPGGRHPRIGFLDGAVRPQRETKVSVFAPWDDSSYAVVDVPEAIWSNLGLTYLAHTHVPTVWTKKNIELEPLEWNRRDDGSFDLVRKLPNGIVFGAKVVPGREVVRMELWLTNGTKELLTDMRIQNCVMLKGMRGFDQQTNDNKLYSGVYAACRSPEGKRWIITGWKPGHRTWANMRCPCLHSDPKFPDCPPGKTVRVQGWLSFYQGTDIQAELRRIEKLQWYVLAPGLVNDLPIRGSVVDADTGKPIAARIYVQSEDGRWFFPQSTDPQGEAIPYKKQRPATKSVEMHTTLSAHPFVVALPKGKYTITVEHGKEYLPLARKITVENEPLELEFRLQRWIDLSERGWYSGETHVHRTLDELPTVMLAEDLNVTFPLTYWVTKAFASPQSGSRTPFSKLDPRPIPVDKTHIIYPINTEYEIFTVDKKRHTLGAFFVLNHRSIFEKGVPPVRDIAHKGHREGGLIELDKHNWPWSMALVPIMPVDLFELTNNHVWRTHFGYSKFGELAPAYMNVDHDENGFTERGWIDFGFQNYYALLNCGFRLRPTAGTASGVHPVPLGFGRVYVYQPKGFSYENWLAGLNEGRSFVTTGPMLFVRVNGQSAGHTFRKAKAGEFRVSGTANSNVPLDKIEIVVNGEIVRTVAPANRKQGRGFESQIDVKIPLEGSSWLAVRCWEKHPEGRIRFAHTSPVHIEIEGKPLRPRREEIGYLIDRVQKQIDRSQQVLPEAALAEYREALRIYQGIAKTARE